MAGSTDIKPTTSANSATHQPNCCKFIPLVPQYNNSSRRLADRRHAARVVALQCCMHVLAYITLCGSFKFRMLQSTCSYVYSSQQRIQSLYHCTCAHCLHSVQYMQMHIITIFIIYHDVVHTVDASLLCECLILKINLLKS